MNRTEENLKRISVFSRDNEGRMAFDDWDESKHPRRSDGKFGSDGGANQEYPKVAEAPRRKPKTKFDKDKEAISDNPHTAREILSKRKTELDKLNKEIKTTKNQFRAKCIYQDITRLQKEYNELDKLV